MKRITKNVLHILVFVLATVGLALVFVVGLLSMGCAAQLGPVGFAFGQASICRGPAETFYGTSGEVEAERCEGGYVMGGPVSDPAGRALGVVGQAAVKAGQALGGVPTAPAQPAPPEPCPGCSP